MTDLTWFPNDYNFRDGKWPGENFRWPTMDDLQRLNLKEIPRLKAVRTSKGACSSLQAIQLIFEGGLESPIIDGHPQTSK